MRRRAKCRRLRASSDFLVRAVRPPPRAEEFWTTSSPLQPQPAPSRANTPPPIPLCQMSYTPRGGGGRGRGGAGQSYRGRSTRNPVGRPKHHEDRTAQLPRSLLDQLDGGAESSESLLLLWYACSGSLRPLTLCCDCSPGRPSWRSRWQRAPQPQGREEASSHEHQGPVGRPAQTDAGRRPELVR